jgi:PAS domain S-box-containing protein
MYRILYVDDEPSLLEIGKIFLEQSGQFSVDTLDSAPAALTLLNSKTYDAVISDYQMPGMDGIEFLKKVRTSGNTIPFILFTGRGREEVVIQALNEGADFYLQKGGEPQSQFTELEHQIRQAIQQRRAEASIRDLERREADIINFLPDGTFAIDLDGKVIAWNRAMEEMTGVKAEEILGKGNYEYALPFYGTRRPLLLDLVLQEDKETEKKYPHIIRKDRKLISEISIPILYGGKGAYLWFIASPLYETHGHITGAIESIRDITDRKMTENELRAAYEQITATEEELRENYDELIKSGDALRESEENYRALFDDAADLIAIVDAHGTFLNLNRKFEEESGYPRDEMIDKNVLTSGIVTAPSAAKIVFHLGQVFLGKKSPLFEIDGVAKNGTIVPYEVRATPIIKNGKISSAQAILRNITERRKAGEAVAESEQKFHAVFDAARDGLLIADTETHRFVMANAAILKQLGYKEAELLGLSVTDIHPETDLSYVIGQFEKQNRGEIDLAPDIPMLRRDGTVFYCDISSSAITLQGKRYLLGIFRNVTGRKEAEDALRDSEKTYRTIFENTGTATVLIEENTVISHANAEFVRLAGYPVEEIEGKKSWTEFVVKEDLDRMLAQHRMRRKRRESSLKHYEFRFVTKSGDIRNIFLTIDMIPGTKRSVASLMDITSLKSAEESIRESERKYHNVSKLSDRTAFRRTDPDADSN